MTLKVKTEVHVYFFHSEKPSIDEEVSRLQKEGFKIKGVSIPYLDVEGSYYLVKEENRETKTPILGNMMDEI